MPRPPEYDRVDVVERAMAVFWERGYGKTSVGDLVTATGLKPGSLYAAFGSKKGVFLEVLDEYNRAYVARLRGLARDGSSKIDAIRGLLHEIAEDAASGRDRRGCLTVNALLEMAQHDADIAAHLERHNERVRDGFAELLESARARGELGGDRDIDALAVFLVNNLFGLRVMCRTRPGKRAMSAVVDAIIETLRAGP